MTDLVSLSTFYCYDPIDCKLINFSLYLFYFFRFTIFASTSMRRQMSDVSLIQKHINLG